MAGSKKTAATKRFLAPNQADLAQVLGVSVRTVRDYVAEGMPDRTRGGYDVGKCNAWHRREKLKPDGVTDRKKLAEAIDKERASELKEIEIARKLGETILVSVAELFISLENGRTRRVIKNLPTDFAPFLPEDTRDQIVSEMDQKIEIRLKELSSMEDVDLRSLL